VRRTDQRRAAVFACYQSAVTGASLEEVLERGGIAPVKEGPGPERPAGPVQPYTRELVAGVAQHREELDGLIAEHAIGWDIDRIAPLERCIMRVALYEVLHRPDVPNEVALDEAVETAKLYSGADAPKFVNGILGTAVKELEPEGEN
jgi:transcription antitermination protein NusB